MPIDENTVGREPIVIVKIDQPACARAYGVAPCAAAGAVGTECYQTRATCQDAPNYLETAVSTVSLYFGVEGATRPTDVPYVLPFLLSASVTPDKINLSGADKNANALGFRATARVVFRDAPHSDKVVDPYVGSRSYDPLARGSFWSKWTARNKFGKVGAYVTVYHGYAGQSLAEMMARVFVSDALDFDGGDRVTLRCRDILVKASDERAQVPVQSPGELFGAMDAAQLAIDVGGASIDDYATSGTLRIGSECMTYASRALNGSGRVTFNLSARGTDGTVAAAHSAGEVVQECFRLANAFVDTAVYSILTGFTTIDPAFLDTVDWQTEREAYLTPYLLNGLITKPASVKSVLGEICEQSQVFIRWDGRAQKVRMRAVRAITEKPPVLSERSHILAGSFRVSEKPKERVSRVWVYYDQRDPTGSLTDDENYRRVQGSLDLEKEAPELYGDAAIRTIYARFIRSKAVALQASSRILNRYNEVPVEATFSLDAKDRGYEVGDVVTLEHGLIQDETGQPDLRPWVITSENETVPGQVQVLTAEDATLAGRLSFVMANGSPDYVGDGSDSFTGAWISNNDGFFLNGDPGSKIS